MNSFNSNQLFLLLTEIEKFDLKFAKTPKHHLVILRFPQFEGVFDLKIRGEDRKIAMMPTIGLSANSSPSLYLTYSDYDAEKSLCALDRTILGVSIPVTNENYENFKMEDVFEHKYGTFLTDQDKAENIKIIDAIRSYIQNMVELLVLPLKEQNTRLKTLDSFVADYVPFVRVITKSARCKIKGFSESELNINLVWNGQWTAQLQRDYHPLWNIMLCGANSGIHVPESLERKCFSIPLVDAALTSFWEKTLNIDLSLEAKKFINYLNDHFLTKKTT
jgi:hypothetical protein